MTSYLKKYDIEGINGTILALFLTIVLGLLFSFDALIVAAMYGVPIYWTIKILFKVFMWARSPTPGYTYPE